MEIPSEGVQKSSIQKDGAEVFNLLYPARIHEWFDCSTMILCGGGIDIPIVTTNGMVKLWRDAQQ